MSHPTRRTFLLGMSLAGCGGTQGGAKPPSASASSPARSAREGTADEADAAGEAPSGIPRRPLGRTGRDVSIVGLGGYHLGIPPEAEAIRIMHRAIDDGITFFDNCWDYHEGESERRMGKALAGKREHVFLMTKLDGRTKEAARLQLEDSLRRLRVDHIDLVQVHEVIRDKDPTWVFGDDGAIAALREARQAGKLSFIGFTGHKSPDIHLEMLRVAQAHDFRFDAVQMPLNVVDVHFKSFQRQVLPVLVEQEVGVLGMKPLGSGDIVKDGVVGAEECLRYALSLDTSVVITGCDSMPIYEQAARAGRGFERLGADQIRTLEAKTRQAGQSGQLEGFKTTERFDATSRNPHWLTTGQMDPPEEE